MLLEERTLLWELQLTHLWVYHETCRKLHWDFEYQGAQEELYDKENPDRARGPRIWRSMEGELVFWGDHEQKEKGVLNLGEKSNANSAAGRVRYLEAKLWIQKEMEAGEVQPIEIKTLMSERDLFTEFTVTERHGEQSSILSVSAPSARRGRCALLASTVLVFLSVATEALSVEIGS